MGPKVDQARAKDDKGSGDGACEKAEQMLPAIREDLRLMPGETLASGAPSWLLFDPIRNSYHRLERAAYERISRWRVQSVNSYLTQSGDNEDALKEFIKFLYAQKLTLLPAGADTESFAAQEFASKPPLSHIIIHKYLFFRIPLVRPDRFLATAYPYIRWFFTRPTLFMVITFGLLGLYFTGRQWEQFVSTFMHFLTFEGLVFYGLTLAVLKILHELGHAFTAHHFGSKVPVMGLAFLVMFPILYTDTTNAWELTDRRKRVLIDAAGMLTEIMIACIAIFLWSFLPDSALRSAAFFTATTSWLLSLVVNLNPMMRFDGYYILADGFGIPNLQKEGFAMGRWHMRETLFGLGEPAPPAATPLQRRGLIIYAYATWTYRFFLFIGIALLVHALFPKAIGIILFTIEIGWFILRPIFKELKFWWSLKMNILSARRGVLTLCCSLAALCVLALPWQRNISAPALLRPVQQTNIFPVDSAQVKSILVTEGQHIKRGQIIAILASESVLLDIESTQQSLSLIDAQLARRTADRQDRTDSALLLQSRLREQKRLSGLLGTQQSLIIRAPHDGLVSDLPRDLHEGRFIGRDFRIARLIDNRAFEVIAFPKEEQAQRLLQNSNSTIDAQFIADDLLMPSVPSTLTSLAPTSLSALTEKSLSSLYRGPIAVQESANGDAVPTTAIFDVRAMPQDLPDILTTSPRELRGILKIEAAPQSPLTALSKSVSRVLIREADF